MPSHSTSVTSVIPTRCRTVSTDTAGATTAGTEKAVRQLHGLHPEARQCSIVPVELVTWAVEPAGGMVSGCEVEWELRGWKESAGECMDGWVWRLLWRCLQLGIPGQLAGGDALHG
jgi:hypothetical protein